MNGLYVNNVRLTPNTQHKLKEGDVVQVGVSCKPEEQAPYQWIYQEKLKVKKIRSQSTKRVTHDTSDTPEAVLNEQLEGPDAKRKRSIPPNCSNSIARSPPGLLKI